MPEDIDDLYGTPEECPKGGKHEVAPASVTIYAQNEIVSLEDALVDFNCSKCGRSGSAGLQLSEPNW